MQTLTVNIRELKPGMVVARPILTARGQIIAPAGTVLTDILIKRLPFYKIEEVTVVEEPSQKKAPAAESSPKREVPLVDGPPPKEKKASDGDKPSFIGSKYSYSQKLRQSSHFQSFQNDYSNNLACLKKIFGAIIAGDDSQVSNVLLNQAEQLFSSKTALELFDLLHVMRSNDDSVYAHSMNVALIARAIGKWLFLPAEDLQTLTLAGMLHDIGKTQIPENILNKPGKYTDQEFALVRSHTLKGHSILKGKGFDPRIPLAALQHHERQDGSGYPRGLQADEIDDFASIIAIADVYDAMTAARSYRTPRCAFQVIAAFEEEGLQKYHAKYILTFLERIAAAYQNSRVILNDGKGARVVYLNNRSLSRPMVELDDDTILDLSAPEHKGLFIQSII